MELKDEYDALSGMMTITGTVTDVENLEYAYDAVEAAFSTAEDLAQAS